MHSSIDSFVKEKKRKNGLLAWSNDRIHKIQTCFSRKNLLSVRVYTQCKLSITVGKSESSAEVTCNVFRSVGSQRIRLQKLSCRSGQEGAVPAQELLAALRAQVELQLGQAAARASGLSWRCPGCIWMVRLSLQTEGSRALSWAFLPGGVCVRQDGPRRLLLGTSCGRLAAKRAGSLERSKWEIGNFLNLILKGQEVRMCTELLTTGEASAVVRGFPKKLLCCFRLGVQCITNDALSRWKAESLNIPSGFKECSLSVKLWPPCFTLSPASGWAVWPGWCQTHPPCVLCLISWCWERPGCSPDNLSCYVVLTTYILKWSKQPAGTKPCCPEQGWSLRSIQASACRKFSSEVLWGVRGWWEVMKCKLPWVLLPAEDVTWFSLKCRKDVIVAF